MQEQTQEVSSSPQITQEQIQTAALEAAKSAVSEYAKANPTVSEDRINSLVGEKLKTVASALTGQEQQAEVDPLLRNLLTKPVDTLALFGEEVRREIRRELETERAEERAMHSAILNVLGERPDITANKSAKSLVDSFYLKTDVQKPHEERIRDAVKQYDLHMEELGAGDAKSRLAKITAITNASASASEPQANQKSEEESWKEELTERLAHHRKTRELI